MDHRLLTTMKSSFLVSTPCSSIVAEQSAHKIEVSILDQVSKMTLDEPVQAQAQIQADSTPSPRFHTPEVRKRKNSFVVTPPLLAHPHDNITTIGYPGMQQDGNANNNNNATNTRYLRGLPPLLPNSKDLDADHNKNLLERHRPIHSPFGVSRINADFIASMFATSTTSSSTPSRIPRLLQNQQQQQQQQQPLQFHTMFPELTDDDEIASRRNRDLQYAASRALKMRRRNMEEYPVFEENL